MVLRNAEPDRREMLATTGSVVLGALAGCSGIGGTPTPTPGPDAGTDSYGLLVKNSLAGGHEVYAKATQTFGDPTPLEQTFTIDANGERVWHGVMTEPVEYKVRVKIDEAVQQEVQFAKSSPLVDSVFITPGDEDAPDVENVVAHITTGEKENVILEVTAGK